MSEQPGLAILKLQIEHMRKAVLIAVQDYHAALDKDLRAAVEEACSDGTVSRVIREAVQRTLSTVVEEEIKHFFSYGEGRKAIAAIVAQRMVQLTKPDSEVTP